MKIDYEMKKNVLRIMTIVAGLFCIIPVELSFFMNYRILDFVYVRMLFGAAALLFAIGSWKKLW